MRKHETAVCRTARTVVWEVGKREVGGKHFYQRLPPTRLLGLAQAENGFQTSYFFSSDVGITGDYRWLQVIT